MKPNLYAQNEIPYITSVHVAIQKKIQFKEFYQNINYIILWNLKDAESSDTVDNMKKLYG